MANTDFSVLLQAIIDKSGINTELKQVQEIVKKYTLELTPEFNKASLKNSFRAISDELARDINKAFGTNLTGNDVFKAFEGQARQAEQQMKQTAKEAQNLATQVKNIGTAMGNGGKTATDIEILRNNFTKLGLSADQVKVKMDGLDKEVAELQTLMSNGASNQAIVAQWEQVQRVMAQTQNSFRQTRSEYGLLVSNQQRLNLANTMEKFLIKNPNITKSSQADIQAYITSLRQLNTQMGQMQFDAMKQGFTKIETSMRGLGKLGYNVKQQFAQAAEAFSYYLSARYLVMGFITELQNAVTEIKEVDTYLTEISKANDKLSKSDLAGIGDRSFGTASRYGQKATDYLAGVQEMSRAGYENAEAMGELSVKAQGAGAMTADVANSFIVAADKAYKMNGSVEQLTKTMDGINYITNHNAVNMTELSEGFSIVGSTAASFGVEANQLTAALGTMAATTQQSGSEVARAFRAILLNIRQVSDEEEGIDAEGLTKYEKAVNDLGVSLKETKDGILQTRDAMDVLEELSKAYKDLDENDLRRTNLLNSVGGKLRATQLDALLRNWDTYEKMLGEYETGTGSMTREAEKTANSLEGRLNSLSNTFTDTVENITSSDLLKWFVSLGDGALKAINGITSALGSFGSIAAGVGIGALFKNFGRPKMFGLKLLF